MAIDLQPEEQFVLNERGRVLGKIKNEVVEVEQMFHVQFLLDGHTVKDTVISRLGIGEVLTIPVIVEFSKGGTHNVEMLVDSRDEIIEVAETNNVQKLVIEILEGIPAKLVVRPNPFTPNGDGYNDEVIFQFAGMGLISPAVKIFDRRGIEVKEISGSTGWLSWDGQNESGREMEPGVYLFILIDGENKLKGGTVVLAR